MVPQFMARFENTVLLNELPFEVLKKILLESYESPFVRSRRFFKTLGIRLQLDDLAASLIAEAAAKDSRTGARALRPLFTEIVNPYEFDPDHQGELPEGEEGLRVLEITPDMARAVI